MKTEAVKQLGCLGVISVSTHTFCSELLKDYSRAGILREKKFLMRMRKM